MATSAYDEFLSDPKNMRVFQQERAIFETTELIESAMTEKKMTRAELASKLGKSRGWVTQLLDADGNKTIRTVADVLAALGFEFVPQMRPIAQMSVRREYVDMDVVSFDLINAPQPYRSDIQTLELPCHANP